MKKRYLKHSPKSVVLVGMGPSIGGLFDETLTQEMMPDHHDEVWSINMASNLFHSDLVVWMDDLETQEQFKPGLFAILRRRKTKVLTTQSYPEILKNSYDYPIDKVAQISTPYFGKPYLNNGVAMAIGYAMSIGVKKLKMYGCDFTYPNRNYAEEGRGCTEAWIALASVSGMEIALPKSTSLFDSAGDKGIYGYKIQPQIQLGGGKIFHYATPEEVKELPGYTPEDSSGAQNVNVPGRISGTPVVAADARGGHSPAANGAAKA